MNGIRYVLSITMLVLGASAAAESPSIDIRDGWRGTSSSSFAAALMPGAGFSFSYGGKVIGPVFGDDWTREVRGSPQNIDTVLTHASGLVVTRNSRIFREFDAIEYTLRFKNNSDRPLPAIASLHSLNIAFDRESFDETCVLSSVGQTIYSALPRPFALQKFCFTLKNPAMNIVRLGSEGGLSSNKDLPFFFIHHEKKKEGLFVAFGWSGQWIASTVAERNPETGAVRKLKMDGWIPGINIALQPGEEIQGPVILVGIYDGEPSAGSNRLRRLLREVYTPKLAGKTFLPTITYDHFFGGIADRFDESLLRKLADGAAAIGQEYFLLDAGWYKGAGGDSWFGVGNWYEIDRGKLPNGIKPIGEYVRAKGMKFGLWFEPERVHRDSALAREHHDWVLWNHPEGEGEWWYEIERASDQSDGDYRSPFGLLDYSRPEVQEWVRSMMEHYITAEGIRYIRYDFNLIDPLPYWNAKDLPDRRGLTQVRHVQGFYAIIDWIRERHPEVVLEACASGGRRMDLETARRFHTFFLTDDTHDPLVVRFNLSGINFFLPGNYPYTMYNPYPPEFYRANDLAVQSSFGGPFGTGGRVDLWQMKERALLHVNTYKKLRRYLIEDYYLLGDQPSDNSWSGWQFQDPSDRSGFIQTFRANAPGEAHHFLLHELEEQAHYRFEDVYGSEVFEITGLIAMTKGVELKQVPMSSRVFAYRKIYK